MTDPFSIASGALTVVDVCVRVSTSLREIAKTAKQIGPMADGLEQEISNFQKVYDALEDICSSEAVKRAANKPPHLQDPCATLLEHAAEIVTEGQRLLEELESQLFSAVGQGSSGSWKGLDDARRAIRLFRKQDNFASTRRRLGGLTMELNTMMTAVELVSNTGFRLDVYRSFDQLPQKVAEELQLSMLQLKGQIGDLESSQDTPAQSILTAKAAISYASLNQHFYVQTPDTSIWTGRTEHLKQLKAALLAPPPMVQRAQRRFVIHGIAGAGKTQVCSKFAQDFRESFWGIFWVDATSTQSASASWRSIAKLGGKEPHEGAGKYWLSNLQSPWLLIIDSANNSEDAIQSNFPSGDRGCVLITTRNPRLIASATAGTMSLDRLDELEAHDLLRKATRHSPWDASAQTAAASIALRLGYLPLALIHAGRAIFHQFCTLQGYIPWFDHALSSFRRERLSRVIEDDEVLGQSALSSFEITYSGLEAQASKPGAQARIFLDAIELANVSAFLHCNDIRLETFTRAGRNLQQIRDEAAGGSSLVVEEHIRKAPWGHLKDWALVWGMRLWPQEPAFPQIFRSIKAFSFDETRTRRAIDLLVRMAMVSESSEQGRYSMHPLVHDWLRNRLSLAEQALWCQAAGNILASSIKLPPLVDEQSDRYYYIRLLSHVRHVQSKHSGLSQSIQDNGESYWRRTLAGLLRTRRPAAFTFIDAGNLARYSRVYMESGKYADAERLQTRVSDFLQAQLGATHQLSIRVQLALSGTMWHQGRTGEAIRLQEVALAASISTAGQKHPQSLRLMDALGETRWMCGRLKEAKALLEAAVEGMQNRPDMARDWFKAADHLGRVHSKYDEFDEALHLHERATSGLTALMGADDPDTWVAMDNLAMTLVDLGGSERAARAHDLMERVYAGRAARFGAEHYYTLWAADNLGRAMAARGSSEGRPELVEQAARIMRAALEAALRNPDLGALHIGVLAGRSHLASVDAALGNYAAAEAELRQVMRCQKHLSSASNGTHPDRLDSMVRLARCLEAQGRLQEAVDLCEAVVEELGWLGGRDHPLRAKTLATRDQLAARLEAGGERGA